jgi:hypothetical protein
MIKTLGIRTLMVWGTVTFIAQQPLAVQAVDSVSIIQELKLQEGQTGTLTFQLFNDTGHSVTLPSPPLFEQKQIGGLDPADQPTDLAVQAWLPGTELPAGKSTDIDVIVHTTADSPPDIPPDFGLWDITSNKFTVGGVDLIASGDVKINDAPVVPEASSLVLVGVCALSVCGLGWLRSRRILSKA